MEKRVMHRLAPGRYSYGGIIIERRDDKIWYATDHDKQIAYGGSLNECFTQVKIALNESAWN